MPSIESTRVLSAPSIDRDCRFTRAPFRSDNPDLEHSSTRWKASGGQANAPDSLAGAAAFRSGRLTRSAHACPSQPRRLCTDNHTEKEQIQISRRRRDAPLGPGHRSGRNSPELSREPAEQGCFAGGGVSAIVRKLHFVKNFIGPNLLPSSLFLEMLYQ